MRSPAAYAAASFQTGYGLLEGSSVAGAAGDSDAGSGEGAAGAVLGTTSAPRVVDNSAVPCPIPKIRLVHNYFPVPTANVTTAIKSSGKYT